MCIATGRSEALDSEFIGLCALTRVVSHAFFFVKDRMIAMAWASCGR